MRENALWSIGWIGVALASAPCSGPGRAARPAPQYLAGYLLERSLSLDNIFVFAVILAYFAVPGEQVQAKVLAWGIMLALVLRLIFILLGAALLDAFHITFYVFGALLLYTAWKLARHDDTEIEPEHNPAAQAAAQAGHDDRGLRRRQAVHAASTASASRRRCWRSSW